MKLKDALRVVLDATLEEDTTPITIDLMALMDEGYSHTNVGTLSARLGDTHVTDHVLQGPLDKDSRGYILETIGNLGRVSEVAALTGIDGNEYGLRARLEALNLASVVLLWEYRNAPDIITPTWGES